MATGCPSTDERGGRRQRPCDIGAYDTDGNPAIRKITPAHGTVGKRVIIKGSSLQGATSVTFDGTPAVVIKDSDEARLVTQVPAGARSGPISVTTGLGKVVSTTVFTVT